MDKKERFERAYNYLKFQGIIKKQEDVAKAMSATRSNVSLALNGNPIVLTDNFLMRFAKAFPGIFNYDWLLSGDGEMLTVNQPQTKQEPSNVHYIDNGSMLNALLAAKDETIAAMQNQLATKDEIIQAKDDVIAGLRQQLKSLRSQIEQTELKTELSGYPFPMGAAETERDYKRK
jgi:hypothetical protein